MGKTVTQIIDPVIGQSIDSAIRQAIDLTIGNVIDCMAKRTYISWSQHQSYFASLILGRYPMSGLFEYVRSNRLLLSILLLEKRSLTLGLSRDS